MNKNFFIKHVFKFMLKMDLFPYPPSSRAFIAVSTGVDSLSLLHCLHSFNFLKEKEMREKNLIREIIILHVNHNTRGEENYREERFLKDLAKKLHLRIEIEYMQNQDNLKGNLNSNSNSNSNFEFKARELRYAFFKKMLTQEGDRLYTAHHIDDSFEWSLMQKFKSSNIRSTLGIPVRNGLIARPFMCVTKKQIYLWAKTMNIDYFEDNSNSNTHYDRNYIRQKIIPSIASRFPSYLKHYVYRSNDLAKKLKLNICLKTEKENETKTNYPLELSELSELVVFKDFFGGVIFYNSSNSKNFCYYRNLEQDIVKVVCSLSNKGRGVLRSQVIKLINAASSGDRWGPIVFSGGVHAYIFSKMIFFVSERILRKYTWLDEKNKNTSQIPLGLLKPFPLDSLLNYKIELVRKYNKHHFFPFFLISKEKESLNQVYRGIMREYPLWPNLTSYLIKNNYWFRPAHDVINFINKNKIKGNKLKTFQFYIL
ncbi:MAG: tRNA lysidine(34) synthetase TilS [Oligoflexia bacterium]|nr:tRNA lysidine(34) synthetase TilS [Oligoflexia bacterium]